jgi:transaldolase
MKFFVDTADVKAIKELNQTGLLDGVTTNPSLILQSGRDFKEVIKEICNLLPGLPVSAEVTALDSAGMIKEGEKLAEIADNVVIKLPLTMDGLKACKHFSNKGIQTNVTLCFSSSQALLAAKAGATYVSPFVGRLDDIAQDGMDLIRSIVQIYRNYDYTTQVLVASIRNPMHVVWAAEIGADVCTIPPKVITQLSQHVLTDKGVAQFTADWEKTGQKI